MSGILCRHLTLCKVASIFIHADILVLISEFLVVVILSEWGFEWWSMPITDNHCGHIPDKGTFVCDATYVFLSDESLLTCMLDFLIM